MNELKELSEKAIELYNDLSNHMTTIYLKSRELKLGNNFTDEIEDIDDDIDSVGDKLYKVKDKISKLFNGTPESYLTKLKKDERIDLPSDLLNDKEFMLKAIEIRPTWFGNIGKDLEDDWLFVSNIIKNFPLTFQYAKDNIKDDYQAALLAVSNYGNNIRYISDKLKSNNSICLAAVKNNCIVYKYLTEEIRADKIITKVAVTTNLYSAYNFQYTSQENKNDIDFIKSLMKENNHIYDYLNYEMKINNEIMKLIIDGNCDNFVSIPDEGKEKILDYVIEKDVDHQYIYDNLPVRMRTPKNFFKILKYKKDLKNDFKVKEEIKQMFN